MPDLTVYCDRGFHYMFETIRAVPSAPARRMRVSAPRPDSFMLRLRSLRAAGVMGLRGSGPALSGTPLTNDISTLRDHFLRNCAR